MPSAGAITVSSAQRPARWWLLVEAAATVTPLARRRSLLRMLAQKRRRIDATDRGVKDLHDMDDWPVMPGGLRGGANLHHAARVRGDDGVGARGVDVVGLAASQRSGHLRLDEVEDTGAAATELTFGEWLDR